jgi:hypothetical protein
VEINRGQSRGIPGVLVSNGVEVTPTDADGAYTLPVRDGVFVEVTGSGVLMLDGVVVATRGAALAIPVGMRNPERYATTDTTENIC